MCLCCFTNWPTAGSYMSILMEPAMIFYFVLRMSHCIACQWLCHLPFVLTRVSFIFTSPLPPNPTAYHSEFLKRILDILVYSVAEISYMYTSFSWEEHCYLGYLLHTDGSTWVRCEQIFLAKEVLLDGGRRQEWLDTADFFIEPNSTASWKVILAIQFDGKLSPTSHVLI